MDLFQKTLFDRAHQIGVDLTEEQLSQFALFYQELVEKNKVMNLTSITEPEEVINKHFVDSLALSYAKSYYKDTDRILDVGTGAGFPGIPLKIAFPEMDFTLNDSLNKRLQFINEVIHKCNLNKITTVHARAEDLAHDRKYRGAFDLVVSRAVARMDVLMEYDIPFLKVHGHMIAYKSGEMEEEMAACENAMKLLFCRKVDEFSFTLPDTDIKRTLIVLEKCKETPNQYPRKAGLPAKKPLG